MVLLYGNRMDFHCWPCSILAQKQNIRDNQNFHPSSFHSVVFSTRWFDKTCFVKSRKYAVGHYKHLARNFDNVLLLCPTTLWAGLICPTACGAPIAMRIGYFSEFCERRGFHRQ